MIRTLILVLLLYSQEPVGIVDEAAIRKELEEARKRIYPTYSLVWMITLVAQFQDGTPARGYINCNGSWYKFDEAPDEYSGNNRPFKTDSRGACIFNPSASWFDGGDDDIGNMTCYAQSGARSGKLTFRPHDGGTFIITIPGKE